MNKILRALCVSLSVVVWSLSGTATAQLGSADSLKFFSDPNAMQVQVAAVANNGRLITDMAGKQYLVHPAAKIQWSGGQGADAKDIAAGMPLRVVVYDASLDVPVIKLAIIPGL